MLALARMKGREKGLSRPFLLPGPLRTGKRLPGCLSALYEPCPPCFLTEREAPPFCLEEGGKASDGTCLAWADRGTLPRCHALPLLFPLVQILSTRVGQLR
jgi:hypothetical protein